MVKGIAGKPGSIAGPPLVAVLDDDPSFREALVAGISTFGCAAIEAGSPQELFDLLPETQPACLILDYDLPGLDGLGVQAHLARSGYRIPTVFLSACVDERVAHAAVASGAIAFLTKPVRLTQLEIVMQTAIARAGKDEIDG